MRSLIELSGDDVPWEQMSPVLNSLLTKDSTDKVLRFVDECSSFLKKGELDSVLDLLIGGTYLGNDEVHVDNATHSAHHQEGDPVELVLELSQVSTSVEAEVSDRHSENHNELGNHLVDHQVFFVRSSWGTLNGSCHIVVVELVVTEIDDGEDYSEKHDQYSIEEEEWSQIQEHLAKHADQEGQTLEDTQEEEGLDQQDKCGQDKQNLWNWGQDVGDESLDKQGCQANPDVALINKVPWVLGVLQNTILAKLLQIVVSWVDQA